MLISLRNLIAYTNNILGHWLATIVLSLSPDEYRILVDMRWNKQYLDILANKCNFEDEKRYVEFMEELNAVANRSTLRYYFALCNYYAY